MMRQSSISDCCIHFRPPVLPVELVVRNLASEGDRDLVLGFLLDGRGDTAGALAAFRQVQGSSAGRAGEEIARLTANAPLPGADREGGATSPDTNCRLTAKRVLQ